MHAINRLINAGMKFNDAFDAVFWFVHHGNDADMERYVLEFERGQRERQANG